MIMLISQSIRSCCILLFFVMLSGCSSLPAELVSRTETPILTYQNWLDTDPDTKADIRIGGVIAQVTNLENRSRIEVVNLPLNSVGKPDLDAEPKGRFVAYVDGYLESLSYAQGRLISLVGTIDQPESGKVGEYDYTFPVMQVYGKRLWRVEERVVVQDDIMHLHSCRSLYCRSFNYGPKQGRIVQEVK
ncbi:Slp family lipoprotein [Vibrio genomosp. F6]|uniref:Slp family lipoprotein n=1 Tax=Vibrio genomosp. F6 TaxID=723172 RepID=UPI0010BDBF61|nr:Slp family lipoprotein [Vibrio genomosp. F6]TKF23884.1 Slp family lipoprotein [Vibrio genomosp. F6]